MIPPARIRSAVAALRGPRPGHPLPGIPPQPEGLDRDELNALALAVAQAAALRRHRANRAAAQVRARRPIGGGP